MPDAVAAFLADRESRLARLDAELSDAADPREVAWILCGFAGRELFLADCVVYLHDSPGLLTQHAAWGPKRAADHVLESRIRLAIGEGVVGDCARLRRLQRVDDTRLDPRYIVDDIANLSELAVPMLHADGDGSDMLLGVLDSEHPGADYYDVRHEQALVAIAGRGAARLWRLRE